MTDTGSELLGEGETLVLELDDEQLELVLDGLALLDADPGDRATRSEIARVSSVQVLDRWIRYRIAMHQRDRIQAIPTESPDTSGGS